MAITQPECQSCGIHNGHPIWLACGSCTQACVVLSGKHVLPFENDKLEPSTVFNVFGYLS